MLGRPHLDHELSLAGEPQTLCPEVPAGGERSLSRGQIDDGNGVHNFVIRHNGVKRRTYTVQADEQHEFMAGQHRIRGLTGVQYNRRRRVDGGR